MIRFADFKDVEQIARLHVENVRRTHEGYSEVYLNRFNEERQKKAWTKYINRRDCRTIVYECEGAIIGFAAICLFYNQEYPGMLDFLHVSEWFEGKGIGTQLVKSACTLFASEGFKRMLIFCKEENHRARQFYQKFGTVYVGSAPFREDGNAHFSNKLLIKDIGSIQDKKCGLTLGLSEEYKKLCDYMNEDYVLWGAGKYYNLFCEQFGDLRKPKYIFDNNQEFHGLTANGVKIVAPHQTQYPVIITCSKSQEVEKDLFDLNCDKMVAFHPWHDYLKSL